MFDISRLDSSDRRTYAYAFVFGKKILKLLEETVEQGLRNK